MSQRPTFPTSFPAATHAPRPTDLNLFGANPSIDREPDEGRSPFPAVHLLSLVLGLLISMLVLMPLSNSAVEDAATRARPGPRAPAPQIAGRPLRSVPASPPATITVFIVDSQRMADEIEADASLGTSFTAPVGAPRSGEPRQYVVGDTPQADAEIEQLVDYLANLSMEAITNPAAPTYHVVDLRGPR